MGITPFSILHHVADCARNHSTADCLYSGGRGGGYRPTWTRSLPDLRFPLTAAMG